jgi:hypothetical protein
VIIGSSVVGLALAGLVWLENTEQSDPEIYDPVYVVSHYLWLVPYTVLIFSAPLPAAGWLRRRLRVPGLFARIDALFNSSSGMRRWDLEERVMGQFAIECLLSVPLTCVLNATIATLAWIGHPSIEHWVEVAGATLILVPCVFGMALLSYAVARRWRPHRNFGEPRRSDF